MTITIPAFSLVLLVGPTSAGKSSFARRHFLPTEVVSSDACRALVDDDELSLDANQDAFDLVHIIAAMRLRRRRLTVIDATNLQPAARSPLLEIAAHHRCPALAVAFDIDEPTLLARNQARSDRRLPEHVVKRHASQMRAALRALAGERFAHLVVLRSGDEVDNATVARVR